MSEQFVSPQFEQFVGRHFGADGRAWLGRLPKRVEYYRRAWRLEIDRFLPGGLLSCCLAVTSDEGEAVLKLSGPWTPAISEGTALGAWNGGPAPKLLRIDSDGNALLLERIQPATPLRTPDGHDTVGRLAALIQSLHGSSLTPELHDRLPPLGHVVHNLINTAGAEATARSVAEAAELRPRLELARARARSLLADVRLPTLLHGDLENKNILSCNRRGLVAIDPLPCIGDPAYDSGYWLASAVETERRDVLADELAAALDLDAVRVRTWAAVSALEA